MAINPLAIGGGVVAAAAVVGGGLYAGGVFGGSDNSGQGGRAVVKESRSIKDESETYAEKFGGKFAYYFLSTKDNVNTKTWAKKAALVTTTLATDTFFTDVANKQGEEKITELKKKCKEKYGENEGTDKKEAWKEVWKFCSLLDAKPTTIQEAATEVSKIADATQEKNYTTQGQSDGKFGKTLKDKAISTYDKANALFWTLREKEFKAGDLTGAGTASTYFNKTSDKSILTLCREAYEKTAPGDSNETADTPIQANIEKYCALSAQ